MAGEEQAHASAVLIPAYNEAERVGNVIRVAQEADLGPVLVVDDGSRDETSAAARAAGADVLRLPSNLGKGGAVAAGVRELDCEVIVLIDADLVGLKPQHLRDLARPVLKGEVDMTRGVFQGGRWSTTAAQKMMPQLNGQRAVRRELLAGLSDLHKSRYGIEVVITEAARSDHWRTRDIPMADVSQVTKAEKRGFFKGVGHRLKMYSDILRSMVRGGRDGH